jgi:hypothetical protein
MQNEALPREMTVIEISRTVGAGEFLKLRALSRCSRQKAIGVLQSFTILKARHTHAVHTNISTVERQAGHPLSFVSMALVEATVKGVRVNLPPP